LYIVTVFQYFILHTSTDAISPVMVHRKADEKWLAKSQGKRTEYYFILSVADRTVIQSEPGA
jgi:hypothetical protein